MPSSTLQDSLRSWACGALGVTEGQLDVVAGDASNRCYFRLHASGNSFIVVHAPPETEKNAEFLAVREMLARSGIEVPALLGADLQRGFLLLGDLGDQLLLPALNEKSVDGWYRASFEVLLKLARAEQLPDNWPTYDRALLSEELSRFPAWFADKLLDTPLDAEAMASWGALCDVLIESALEQPRVLVHRDFHSRNLMVLPNDQLGVIDFQDAVRGPITYDLVSLLRDCYIHWPTARVESWALDYHALLQSRGLLDGVDAPQFLRWFDLMGLQRHLKVLGTFARLYLRDQKPGYLEDLPLVVAYVEEILTRYRSSSPAVAAFADRFRADLRPVIEKQRWWRAL